MVMAKHLHHLNTALDHTQQTTAMTKAGGWWLEKAVS